MCDFTIILSEEKGVFTESTFCQMSGSKVLANILADEKICENNLQKCIGHRFFVGGCRYAIEGMKER